MESFRSAEKNIRDLFGKNIEYGREYLGNYPKGFYLSQKIKPSEMEAYMKNICADLETTFPKIENETIAIVSLEETINKLMSRVDKAMSTSFNEITNGKERAEIIVFFLALLHLLKDTSIEIEQGELFTEIHIKGSNGTN